MAKPSAIPRQKVQEVHRFKQSVSTLLLIRQVVNARVYNEKSIIVNGFAATTSAISYRGF